MNQIVVLIDPDWVRPHSAKALLFRESHQQDLNVVRDTGSLVYCSSPPMFRLKLLQSVCYVWSPDSLSLFVEPPSYSGEYSNVVPLLWESFLTTDWDVVCAEFI